MKYKGSGLGLKPAYEPIILIQKPIEKGLKIAHPGEIIIVSS